MVIIYSNSLFLFMDQEHLAEPFEMEMYEPYSQLWYVPDLSFPFEVYVCDDCEIPPRVIHLTWKTLTREEKKRLDRPNS